MDIPKELVQGSKMPRGELQSLVYYARWVAILRGYCIVVNPIAVYTRLKMQGGMKLTYSACMIPVEDDISNLIGIAINYLDARERQYPSGDLVLKPGANKPWRHCNNPYMITTSNPIRLGDELASWVLGLVRCPYGRDVQSDNRQPGALCEGDIPKSADYALKLVSYVIAWYYNNVATNQVQVAPLTRHEASWVLNHAGRCEAPLIGE